MMRSCLLLFCLFVAGAVRAGPPGTEAELGFTREHLTGNRPDWSSIYLDAVHDFGDRRTVYGEVRETQRFDLRDKEARLGYYHPLGETWTALVEGSTSGEHQVLPKYSLFGQLAKQLGGGWGLSAGWRHSDFNSSGVDLLVFGAERYWGDWRGAYTLYNGRPEGAGSASSHRFQLSYYYGDRSSIGVSATVGREVELVIPGGLVTTDVTAYGVEGRHWFAPAWAVSWMLQTVEQGTLYRRSGLLLGLRHRF